MTELSHLFLPSLGSLSRDTGQRLSQEWKKYQIGRQPVHRLQLIRSKPLCGFVFFEFQIARQDAAPVAVHGKVESRIVIIHGGDETVTLISVSSSSLISRLRACSRVSPGSALPPGTSHQSLYSPYPRWVTNISPLELRMTAATTVIVFIMAAKISNPTEQEKNTTI